MDIKNYYFNNFDGFYLISKDYWDFNLSSDNQGRLFNYNTTCGDCQNNIITDKLLLWFDINDPNTTISGSSLISLTEWSGFTIQPPTGFTLNDVGLTMMDNGRVSGLTGISWTFTSGDSKVILYPVGGYKISGYTESGETIYTSSDIKYDWFFKNDTTTSDGCLVGNTVCLNGGFYQGFLMLDTDKPAPILTPEIDSCGNTGYTLTQITADTKYQLSPVEFNDGWSMETWVKPSNLDCLYSGSTGQTLNDLYSGNSGFFFYIGTRSENKFRNIFSGETGLYTSKGLPLSPDVDVEVDNGGQSWFGCSTGVLPSCICTCTTSNGSGTTVSQYCDELSENSLGFRITNDGKIGYRKLTVTGECMNNKFVSTGTTVEEGYSVSNVIPSGDTWLHIVVTYNKTGNVINSLEAGILRIWVNGKVVYRNDNFIGLKLRPLNEWSDKQIGVPYNISWGGGTQGLLETNTFGGPDNDDKNLLLQNNFTGTFDGELSQLRFYDKSLNILEVRNNFYKDCQRYCIKDTLGGSVIIQPNSEFCGECKSGYVRKIYTYVYNGYVYCLYVD